MRDKGEEMRDKGGWLRVERIEVECGSCYHFLEKNIPNQSQASFD